MALKETIENVAVMFDVVGATECLINLNQQYAEQSEGLSDDICGISGLSEIGSNAIQLSLSADGMKTEIENAVKQIRDVMKGNNTLASSMGFSKEDRGLYYDGSILKQEINKIWELYKVEAERWKKNTEKSEEAKKEVVKIDADFALIGALAIPGASPFSFSYTDTREAVISRSSAQKKAVKAKKQMKGLIDMAISLILMIGLVYTGWLIYSGKGESMPMMMGTLIGIMILSVIKLIWIF